MSQTSKIAGALILAFVVFIISRGELPSYMGILGIGGHSVPDNCGASVTGIASAAGSSLATNFFPGVSLNLPSINIGGGSGGGGGVPTISLSGISGGFGDPFTQPGGPFSTVGTF